jgi:hypothetical protein
MFFIIICLINSRAVNHLLLKCAGMTLLKQRLFINGIYTGNIGENYKNNAFIKAKLLKNFD